MNVTPELIVVAIIAVVGVVLHLLPRKPSTDPAVLQKIEKVDDAVWAWMVEHLRGHAAPTAASAPAPVVPPAPQAVSGPTTWTIDGTKPSIAGIKISPPDAPETYNGMLVPPGMTLAQFTQLGGAVQAARAQLHPEFASYLMSGSQAWWNGLGTCYREALLHFATGDVLAALWTKQGDTSAPALLSITANQWAAASAAVATP